MARAIRWLREHRPEDLLLNGLLTVAVLGALAVGYWAWRSDSSDARPVVAGRVVTQPPSSTRPRPSTTTTTAAPAPELVAPVAPVPPLLPDTGPARRTRRTTNRSGAGTVVTAPPQVLTSVPPTTPPTTAPATSTTTRPTSTTTNPPTTTTTEAVEPGG